MNKFKSLFVWRVSLREQAYFASRLAFLVGAEIPLLDGLQMLYAQAKKKKEKNLINKIVENISQGSFLSSSLEKTKPRFNMFAIQIIRTGEMTGNLSANLRYVSEELKKRQILFQKIIGAFFYPLCIGFATVGVTGMITLYILPKITPIFSSLRAELPMSTRILISFHSLVKNYWVIVLLVLLMFFTFFVILWKKSKPFKIAVQYLCLKIPIFGQIFRFYEMTQTFRALGLLLKSGVTLKDAIKNVSDGCCADIYRKEYLLLSQSVSRGLPISHFLAYKETLFPTMLSQMLSVGESSGNLVEVSTYISEYYERELDEIIKKLSSMLEPALMVIMGIVVGFVAISVIAPIYQITQNIKR